MPCLDPSALRRSWPQSLTASSSPTDRATWPASERRSTLCVRCSVRSPPSGSDGVELTHRNLYDGTVEGIASPRNRAWSVQYHPESSPGPRDSGYLFEE